ncbi:MAG TPA: alpha/beta hydrolase [Stellaceae bacterium]|nr:alpha/beta hydrolase [Stellaceae bacterium]
MATFVLVHGAWHGGWCYKRVARLLRRAGHEVYTPTLTGLGERAHLLSPAVTLDTHIDDVLGVLRWEELNDVILCGHSYGGMVISGVVEKAAAGAIRSLVFLDAFVPQGGQSLLDLLPPELAETMRADARQNGEGYKISPIPAEAFSVNAADAAWVNAMCVKQSIATFEQRVTLTGAREKVKGRLYILASGWQPSPFPQFAERVGRDPDWQLLTIECGHDVMLDRPEELADALVAAAA